MAMAHSATISDVISWEPCGFDGEDDGENYTPARLRRLAEGRESVTIEDIAALDIPVEDRIWAGLHLLDEREQRLWGCDCAERALLRERDAGREPDPRSWEAVRVSRLYADGEATLEELDAAWSAWHAAWDADAAARAAADAAAWVAADAPAWVTASAAASAAADAAARDAARNADAAAWVAADAAEREWQLAHLVEYAT